MGKIKCALHNGPFYLLEFITSFLLLLYLCDELGPSNNQRQLLCSPFDTLKVVFHNPISYHNISLKHHYNVLTYNSYQIQTYHCD